MLGILFMSPIWILALFLGGPFILDSARWNARLTICLFVAASALAYLSWVSTKVPTGSLVYPPEIQAIFLSFASGLSAVVSLLVTRIKSDMKKAALEGVTIILLESLFILFSLTQSFPSIAWVVSAFSLAPFAFVAILGIGWRVCANTSRV